RRGARTLMATATPAACAHAIVALVTDVKGDDVRAWWACRECKTPFAPVGATATAVDVEPAAEYLSTRQLAQRIPYTEGQIRNMMSLGVFRLGDHFTRPTGPH